MRISHEIQHGKGRIHAGSDVSERHNGSFYFTSETSPDSNNPFRKPLRNNNGFKEENPKMTSSSKWLEILKNSPDRVNECPCLEDFSGWQWCQLVDVKPQFAGRCRWEKLDGFEWGFLLRAHPQFADFCNWEKMDGQNLAWVFEKHPQLAERCCWRKLRGNDWASLLALMPEYAGKCYWNRLNGWNWSILLIHRPEFTDRCPWHKLKGLDWRILLLSRPELADFCDWERLDGNDCAELLRNSSNLSPENYKKLKKRSDQIRVRIGWLDGFWTSLKESQCGSCRFLSKSLFYYVCFYYPPHPCASRVPVTHGIPVEYWNNRKQCPRRKPPGLAASHHLSDFALKWLPRIRQLFSLRLQYEFETEMLLLGFPHDLVQTASGEIPGVQILKKTEDLTFLTSAIFAYQKKWKNHERSDPEWLSAALSRLSDLTAPAVEREKCGKTPESAGI